MKEHPDRRLPDLMRTPSLIYLVFAVPYTFLLVWLLPPFQVPDEGHHYLRAVAISSGQLLPSNQPGKGSGGVIEDSAETFMNSFLNIPFRPDIKVGRAKLDAAGATGFGGPRSFHDFPAATVYPPYTYATSTVAVELARAAHLSQLDALRLARLANAVVVLLATSLAIAIVPTGKWSLAAICLLPMFIAQAAGVTSDGTVFALALPATALIARFALMSKITPGMVFVAAALIAAASAVRPPTLALALPLLVVGWLRLPAARTRRALTLNALAAVAVVPAALWLAFATTQQVDSRLFGLGDFNAGRQVGFILQHPGQVVGIARDTLRAYGVLYFMQFVGVLGFLDAPLRAPLVSPYGVLAVLLVGVLAVEVSLAGRIGKRVGAAFLAAAVASAALVFASLYLSWSPVGNGTVEGVQGRYFIPVAAMVVAALAGTVESSGGRRAYALPVLVVLIYAYSMPVTIWTIVDRYYLK